MSDAEIYATGYRPFDGERTGWFMVVSALIWSTVRSSLGLGRPARHKVFPAIVVVLAFVPAVVFTGLAVLFPVDVLGGDVGPAYWEMVGFAWLPVLVFCAMVVPEALVQDRRNMMFSLAMTTPLTRGRYLLGKAIAAIVILAVVIAAPALLFLIGVTAEGSGPDGVLNWVGTVMGIVAAGIVIATILVGVGFAVASLTDRRAFASASLVLLFVVGPIVAEVMTSSGLSPNWWLVNAAGAALEFAPRIWGERSPAFDDVSDVAVVLGQLSWLLGAWSIVGVRYRKLEAL